MDKVSGIGFSKATATIYKEDDGRYSATLETRDRDEHLGDSRLKFNSQSEVEAYVTALAEAEEVL